MFYNKHERHHECFANEEIDFIVDDVPGEFFGIHLSPDLSNYITNLFDNRIVNLESLASTSGGAIFYGNSYNEKKITLKCFYYIDDVIEGALNDIYNFYNTKGKRKLYFSQMPWIEYEAIVTKINHQLYSKIAGIIIIEFTIPKGFGKFRNPNISSGKIYERFINNSGYFKDVPVTEYCNITKTINSQQEFYIHNPGNRKARAVIEITGSAADGLNMYNETNGDMLRIRAFDTSTFASPYTKLIIDCNSGKTYMEDNTGTATANGFKYHRSGSLCFVSSEKIDVDDIISATKSGSDYIITVNKKIPGVIGKCFGFYISGNLKYLKIKSAVVSDSGTTFNCESLSGAFTPTALEDTKIVDVNKIIITPVSTANCTIKITFTPEF